MKTLVVTADSDSQLTSKLNEEIHSINCVFEVIDVQYVSPVYCQKTETLLYSAMIKYQPRHSLG